MKKNYFLIFYQLIIFFFVACKQQIKDSREKFFPVLSYIQSEVKEIDTSLYYIRKVKYLDSLRTDTLHLNRENFREEAVDFLSIPDISSSEYQNRFKEEKQVDEMLNRVLLIYTPINSRKEIIQRQEVLIKPDPTGDKVTHIIINSLISTKDSLVEKKMLWKVDDRFQVITTRQLPGLPETTSTVKVFWNEEF